MHSVQQHRKGGAKGQGLSTTDLAKMMQFDVKNIGEGNWQIVAESWNFQSSASYFKRYVNADSLRILNKQMRLTFISEDYKLLVHKFSSPFCRWHKNKISNLFDQNKQLSEVWLTT